MISKIRALFSCSGLLPHDWKVVEPFYQDEQAKKLAIESISGYRICVGCGKKQKMIRHCLGLNPPEYIIEYE